MTTTNLTVPSPDTSITNVKSSELSVPRWASILLQMAQDYRQDLAPDSVKYWRLKLNQYQNEEIAEALLLYAGEYFPSTAQVIEIADRLRERRAEEKAAEFEDANRRMERNQWKQFLFEHHLPPDLTPARYWCDSPEGKRQLRQLAEKMAMAPEWIRRGNAVRRK
jgi:hypothetical protein